MKLNLDLNKIGIPEKFKFYIHDKDKGLSKELIDKGFREPHNSKYLYRFINKKDRVLDIGANLGYFTLLCKNAKKIICVEPIPEAVSILKKNIEINGLKEKCKVLNAIVGKKEEKLILEIHEAFNSSKIISNENERSIKMNVLPLKSLVKKYKTNLLRLDLEGYEHDLLLNNISKNVNKISLEFHSHILNQKKIIQLLRYFEEENFKIQYLITFFPKRFERFYLFFKKTRLEKLFFKVFENINFNEAFNIIKNKKTNFLIKLYSKYKLKSMRDCYIFLKR